MGWIGILRKRINYPYFLPRMRNADIPLYERSTMFIKHDGALTHATLQVRGIWIAVLLINGLVGLDQRLIS